MSKLESGPILHEIFDDSGLQSQIIDLNTGQLYDKGIRADGVELGQYAPFTIEYKTKVAGGLGNDTRVDHITLRDTGAFYSSFRFKNESDGFVIEADTIKDGGDDLADIYGIKILGLTNESIGEIKPEIVERMVEKIRIQISG